jgi:hypothetical protein
VASTLFLVQKRGLYTTLMAILRVCLELVMHMQMPVFTWQVGPKEFEFPQVHPQVFPIY